VDKYIKTNLKVTDVKRSIILRYILKLSIKDQRFLVEPQNESSNGEYGIILSATTLREDLSVRNVLIFYCIRKIIGIFKNNLAIE